jgi:hypothetical protein
MDKNEKLLKDIRLCLWIIIVGLMFISHRLHNLQDFL